MTERPALEAFEAHDAFERTADGFSVTTTTFDATATASDQRTTNRYTLVVGVPTLAAATASEVGDAVASDWLRTLRRRLEDAPQTTRADVELEGFEVEKSDETVQIEYTFEWSDPKRGVEITKAFAEFVEGTYVEGIIAGYEYEPPVSSLLSGASHGEGAPPL